MFAYFPADLIRNAKCLCFHMKSPKVNALSMKFCTGIYATSKIFCTVAPTHRKFSFLVKNPLYSLCNTRHKSTNMNKAFNDQKRYFNKLDVFPSLLLV